VLRGTIVQTETPDQLRGRVTSIYVMSVSSGPRLGDIRATTLASAIGAQASVVAGGLLCILGAFVVARAFPELLAQRLRLRGEREGPAEQRSTVPPPGAEATGPPPPGAESAGPQPASGSRE
jgi:hypothetical protein